MMTDQTAPEVVNSKVVDAQMALVIKDIKDTTIVVVKEEPNESQVTDKSTEFQNPEKTKCARHDVTAVEVEEVEESSEVNVDVENCSDDDDDDDDDDEDDDVNNSVAKKKLKADDDDDDDNDELDDDYEGETRLPRMMNPLIVLFQKPFQTGWYRELVVRGTSSDERRRPADVYYFTPTGRKLRSTPQIANYLAEHPEPGLTAENFTFKKETVYKAPFEVVRSAGIARWRNSTKPGSPSPVPTTGQLSSKRVPKPSYKIASKSANAVNGKRSILTKTAGGVKLANKKSATAANKKIAITVDAKKKPTSVIKSPTYVKTVVIYPDRKSEILVQAITKPDHVMSSDESDCGDVTQTDRHCDTVAPPIGKTPTHSKRLKARKSFVRKRPLEGEPCEVEAKRQKVFRVCGMNCPGQEGVQPSLACGVCQKLCHHECVGVLDDVENFVCDCCYKRHDDNINDALCVPNFQPQALATGNNASQLPQVTASLQLQQQQQVTASLQLQQLSSALQLQQLSSSRQLSQLPSMVLQRPQSLVMTTVNHPLIPIELHTPSTAYSMRTPQPLLPVWSNGARLPPPLTRAPPRFRLLPRLGFVPMPPGRGEFSMSSTPKRSDAQLLTIPSLALEKLKMDSSIELFINGTNVMVDPKRFVQTPEGAKILLPAGTLLNHGSGEPLRVNIPPQSLLKPEIQKQPPALLEKAPQSEPQSIPQSAPTLAPKPVKKSPKHARPGPASSKCKPYKSTLTMEKLLGGYQCMVNVFKYLELPDLLRASQVCRSWRSLIANHANLLSITLEDCSITNWPRFADFLLARKTETLDLIGLELTGKFDKEWTKFISIVPKLRYLRHLSLGQCPPSVLYTVAEELPYLESLHAEHITETDREPEVWCTNATIDLGKLASFKCLKELRLRGISGLNTPSMAYSSLQRLSQLKQLRQLSLTSLKNLDGFELSFLETLNLEDLEIGDCDSWTEETYAYLNKMNLQKLHLENGGLSNQHLALALPNWHTLKELDLIMMAVDESTARGLSRLTNLESFSICPDTRDNDALTNRNTLLAVRDLKHLKYFLWCAVMATSEDGKDEMEFLRQGIEDSLYYGETGLPPPEQLGNQGNDDVSRDEQNLSDLEIDEEIAMIEGRQSKWKMKTKENEDDMEASDDESITKVKTDQNENMAAVSKEREDCEQEAETEEVDVVAVENQRQVSVDVEEDLRNGTSENGKREVTSLDDGSGDGGMNVSRDSVNDSAKTKCEQPELSTTAGGKPESNKTDPQADNTAVNDSSKNDSKPDSSSLAAASPKKRRKKKTPEVEPRRSGRRRKLKKSDDSSIAFVDVETLISILEFHLPNTDIRVDPIGLMK